MSLVAGGWAGRVGSRLINVSQKIVSVPWNLILVPARKVAQGENPLAPEPFQLATAVQNMAPDSRFVSSLRKVPMSEAVTKHSIVGVKGEGPAEEGNDGVVAYESAHLSAAVSEVVVRSGHSLQSNPVTVQEVRRILLEHLEAETGNDRSPLDSEPSVSKRGLAVGLDASPVQVKQGGKKEG